MRKFVYLCLLLAIAFTQFCSEKYNVVRMRNDKYLKTTKYSLATEHELEGPGNLFSNYGKGKRKMRLDYTRELKGTQVIVNDIKVAVQLFDDDPEIDKKLIILINDKPLEISNFEVKTGNKSESGTSTRTEYGSYTDGYGKSHSGPHQVSSSYSISYKTADLKFIPPAPLLQELKSPKSMSIRIYMGAEVATGEFDETEIEAVRRFYANQVDEPLDD